MDHWETLFREKSSRRANANNWPATIGWSFVATGFLALITGIIAGLNLLMN